MSHKLNNLYIHTQFIEWRNAFVVHWNSEFLFKSWTTPLTIKSIRYLPKMCVKNKARKITFPWLRSVNIILKLNVPIKSVDIFNNVKMKEENRHSCLKLALKSTNDSKWIIFWHNFLSYYNGFKCIYRIKLLSQKKNKWFCIQATDFKSSLLV